MHSISWLHGNGLRNLHKQSFVLYNEEVCCLAGVYAILCGLLIIPMTHLRTFICVAISIVLSFIQQSSPRAMKQRININYLVKSDTQASLLAVSDLISPFSFFIAAKSGVWVLLALLVGLKTLTSIHEKACQHNQKNQVSLNELNEI